MIRNLFDKTGSLSSRYLSESVKKVTDFAHSQLKRNLSNKRKSLTSTSLINFNLHETDKIYLCFKKSTLWLIIQKQ